MLDAVTYSMRQMMGCDIHWYSETKKDGKWVCDQADSLRTEDEDTEDAYRVMNNFPGRQRDYWFFALLNHVRGEWLWSFPEQPDQEEGLPDDLSAEVKEMVEKDRGDGHSHGMRTRAELKAKLEEIRVLRAEQLITPDNDYGQVLAHHMTRLEEVLGNLNSPVPDSDQRIVFWFDN
jgi:hypothetical protein